MNVGNPKKLTQWLQAIQATYPMNPYISLFTGFGLVLSGQEDRAKIEYDKSSIELISRSAAGSMRDGLSLLDQAIAYCNGALREPEVRMLLGTIDKEDLNGLIQSLINSDPEKLLNIIETISLKNPDYDALLAELLSLLQKVAIIQLLPEDSKNILKSDKTLVKFAHAMKKEEAQLYYQIGIMGRKDLYFSPDAKSGLEMIMIRMLAFNPAAIDEEIKKKQITN